MLEHRDLTERVIGLAIEVHRAIGPGLLESVYAECMALELQQANIAFQNQVMVPVIYKGTTIPLGFRADIVLVDDEMPQRPRIVAVIAAGRLVHLADASRLIRSSTARHEAVAAE